MSRLLMLFAALCVIFIMSNVAAQEEGETSQEQTQDEPAAESIVTDTHREVWTLEATVVLTRFDLTEAQQEAVVEAYVDARAKHMDSQDYWRDEFRNHRERMIEQSRQSGGVGAGLFDESELRYQLDRDTAHKRKLLARDLVVCLRKELAEQVYPYLGGFDPMYDALVKEIMDFELEDESATDAAALAVMDYQVTVNRARQEAGSDRARFADMRIEIRDAFLKTLEPHLNEEQLARIAKRVGASR